MTRKIKPKPANLRIGYFNHLPDFFQVDLRLQRNFRVFNGTEFTLSAEVFNLFNHANLYVVGNSADVGQGNSVTSCFGCTGSTYDRRNLQLAAKIIF